MLMRELTLGTDIASVFAAVQSQPHSFFLESALPAGGLGRFSFLGFAPFLVFTVRKEGARVTWADGPVECCEGDPLEALRALHRRYATPKQANAPAPFMGGAVGFFSYEFGLRFERIARTSADDLDVPEAEFGFYDGVLACEEATGKMWIVTDRADPAEAEQVAERIERAVRVALSQRRADLREENGATAEVASNFSRASYLAAVERVKAYIASGDVYQINLSQRFEAALPCTPFALYQRLRRLSPAPYGCFLNFGAVQVAGVSPERFLRVDGREVSTRPIKGTRRRGVDAGEDGRLRSELAASVKDRAELLMIVDLERNDLGRVCVPGSVRVENLYALEAHPTVWHQVAEVSGTLVKGLDVFDCVRATFPGGSITGAPKIRAMQIIDELEPHRRHLYTGAMGYLAFNGDAELNIAIRTFQCVSGRAYFHAGGGVVWDSDPESEYEETLTKAKALRAALAGFASANKEEDP